MKRFLALTLVLAPLGAQADPSLECSVVSGSQVEIAGCLAAAQENAETAMQVMLKIARDNATELDGVTGRDVALPALEAAQVAWEAYRDAQCDYKGALFGGGSGTGIEIRSCLVTLTRERTEALQASLR